MPEKFDLHYIGEDNQRHRPVVIHRAVYGSIDRFIGILIEHYAGAFPVWLAPVQARVIPVSNKFDEYATEVKEQLTTAGVRVETDLRNEKLGYKIREAQMAKVPYMFVIGEKERAEQTVSVRVRGQGDIGAMKIEQLVERIEKETAEALQK